MSTTCIERKTAAPKPSSETRLSAVPQLPAPPLPQPDAGRIPPVAAQRRYFSFLLLAHLPFLLILSLLVYLLSHSMKP